MTPPSIGIVGRRRVGKDTVADYLTKHHGYVRVGFADALKRAALALDPIVIGTGSLNGGIRLASLVNELGWERAKDGWPEVRRILQRLGDEAGRQVHGEDTWINQAMDVIDLNIVYKGRPVVVPDVRYPNEVKALRNAGFTLVRITRTDGTTRGTPVDSHASEVGTDNLDVDATIYNGASIEELSALIREHLSLT